MFEEGRDVPAEGNYALLEEGIRAQQVGKNVASTGTSLIQNDQSSDLNTSAMDGVTSMQNTANSAIQNNPSNSAAAGEQGVEEVMDYRTFCCARAKSSAKT